MCNEQIRHAQRALQIHQEIGDLRLHGTIKGRQSLVQNQELRLQRQRSSDGQPLALPAAQLSGKPRRHAWRKTNSFQQRTGAQIHFFVTEFALQNQRLDEYVEHTPSWVQRACGVLKYELDLRVNLTANILSTLGDVYPFKPNVSGSGEFQTGETCRKRTLARS